MENNENEREPALEEELDPSKIANKEEARSRLVYIDIQLRNIRRALEEARQAMETPGEIEDKDWEEEIRMLERNIERYERARRNIEDRMNEYPGE